jgi:hypothetical protein
MRFYKLTTAGHHWGDYFDMLVHGMARRVGARLALSRTGPFTPPMWLPFGGLLVRGDLRREMSSSGLVGISFRLARKALIVKSDWHRWDRSATQPRRYPPGGGPESYVLDQPHSQGAAVSMGPVYEVCLRVSAEVFRAPRGPHATRIKLVESSWRGDDLFMASGAGWIYATQAAREWLEPRVGEFISFEPARTVDRPTSPSKRPAARKIKRGARAADRASRA